MPIPTKLILTTTLVPQVWTFVGIDPGANGGLVAMEVVNGKVRDGGDIIDFSKATDQQVCDLLRFLDPTRTTVGIELNTGYVGGMGQPGSHMFKFGRETGKTLGYLIAFHPSYQEIVPRVWQRGVGIEPKQKKETHPQFKARLKAQIDLVLPRWSYRITLRTCDALLIAEYLRRKGLVEL